MLDLFIRCRRCEGKGQVWKAHVGEIIEDGAFLHATCEDCGADIGADVILSIDPEIAEKYNC